MWITAVVRNFTKSRGVALAVALAGNRAGRTLTRRLFVQHGHGLNSFMMARYQAWKEALHEDGAGLR